MCFVYFIARGLSLRPALSQRAFARLVLQCRRSCQSCQSDGRRRENKNGRVGRWQRGLSEISWGCCYYYYHCYRYRWPNFTLRCAHGVYFCSNHPATWTIAATFRYRSLAAPWKSGVSNLFLTMERSQWRLSRTTILRKFYQRVAASRYAIKEIKKKNLIDSDRCRRTFAITRATGSP